MTITKKLSVLFSFTVIFSACNSSADKVLNTGGLKFSEGEALFNRHCITCHTLRYIEMQPDFPRSTWEKITDKMIKSYGAPIPDSSAKKIVDYLVAVKGVEK